MAAALDNLNLQICDAYTRASPHVRPRQKHLMLRAQHLCNPTSATHNTLC